MEVDEYRLMAEVEHSHWWYESTRRLLREILEPRPTNGGRFLDMGAGTGATGAWLAERGELSPATSCHWRSNSTVNVMTAIGFVAADVNQLPFATGRSMWCSASRCCVTSRSRTRGPLSANWHGWFGPEAIVLPVGARRSEAAPGSRPGDPLHVDSPDETSAICSSAPGIDVERAVGSLFVPGPGRLRSRPSSSVVGSTSDLDHNADGLARAAPAPRPGGTGAAAARRPSVRHLRVRGRAEIPGRDASGQRRALRNSAVSSAIVAGTA